MIPYGRQSISQEDLDAVAEVLRGKWHAPTRGGFRIRTEGRLMIHAL